ncbi:hypothetical protein PR048_001758 [Dryococelus australis]|uniref:Uncharacterized protein n=1 Tax=Dryococelus australis TaxID=614101 RepID=A0ABQ9IIF0_9NEOP|nr:hypothetical protein PR048_001758 [Dryococelus australis]
MIFQINRYHRCSWQIFLRSIANVSVTVNFWISLSMDDYMSLTVQFLHGPRDAEFLNDSRATWGLTGKVTATVRHSVPNLRLAIEKTGVAHSMHCTYYSAYC